VQRLLTSHPEVLIWGEHGGHLHDLIQASKRIQNFDETKSAPARVEFAERGHHGWIANLMPEPTTVLDATRAYLETMFVAPAAAAGRPRWGFKEVQLGFEDAEAIRELFPALRVVHVTRDPRDVLSSIEVWERKIPGWFRAITEHSMQRWADVNTSFLGDRKTRPWVSSWRYEDIVADPESFVLAMADFIEVDPAELDRSVFERVVGDYPGVARERKPFSELPRDMRKLVDPHVRAVAAAYGYSL
jgi:hypothetical protein